MSAIESLVQQPAAQAIGWALLQFVWQGALIGLLTAIVLFALRRSAADVRYVVGTIGLSLMLTMPVVTAVQTWRAMLPANADATSIAPTQSRTDPAPATAPPVTASTLAVSSPTMTDVPARPSPATQPLHAWIPLFLVVWFCGVAILTLRLLGGWLWIQRLKSHARIPAAQKWQELAILLSRRMHLGRPVRLLESTLVDVPTVIGWLRPVVLLPLSALAGLSPQQLEAILAHELAHIRRHDYLVNLLQTLVETLLFYHPAVWWLSRRIRIERENCCDDLAVSLCGDPYAYARALADLEALRGDAGRLALAVTGGSLLHRVRRLLGAPSHDGRGPGWLAATAAVVLMVAIAASAVANDVVELDHVGAPTALEPAPSAPAHATAPGYVGLITEQLRRWLVPPAPPAPPPPPQTPQAVPPAPPAPSPVPADASAPIVPSAPTPPLPPPPFPDLQIAPPAPPAPAATPVPPAPPTPASPPVARPPQPAPPAPPAQPTPPAPPAPPDPNVQIENRSERSGNFTWSDGKQKLEVNYRGDIEFSDDDTDVAKISSGGWLRIREAGWSGSKSMEFTADASGNIQRRYRVGSSERPFDPEGRQWLKEVLPRFIRQTGIGAARRVARILKASGPSGVLAEISLIEGSWAKHVYFRELLKTPLDPGTTQQVLAQASQEVTSDFELASLLIGATNPLLASSSPDTVRQAYFDAARTIESDFEMRRVFASALKQGPVSSDVLAGILDASTAIGSDFEEASLLIQIAKLQPLDGRTRPAFFKALATVESDFEHRRVLDALGGRTDLPPDAVGALLGSATSIESDFEVASLLLKIAHAQPIEGALRDPFFKVVETIGSPFERGRVLQAVVKRSGVSSETILSVLRAAQGMKGSFETSQVLMTVASNHQVTGEARDVYVATAERLGDFEQGRTLAALVKSERRK